MEMQHVWTRCAVIFLAYFVCADALIRGRIVQSTLAKSNNEFAFDLYRKIGESVSGQNLFLSPTSISAALGMVYLGARGNTKKQMTSSMHLEAYDATDNSAVGADFKNLINTLDKPEKNYTLNVANRLFGEKSYTFLDEFLRETETYFEASLEALDFIGNPSASRIHINNWVSDKTQGKIKDLLPDGIIDGLTRLVLVNAIYFNASWALKFHKNVTKMEAFHLSKEKQSTISMMRSGAKSFNYFNSTELGCQVLELQYLGNEVSMYVFLPHDIEGLTKVESLLNVNSLAKVFESVREEQVIVRLPKFLIDQTVSLNQFLQDVGMVDMFVEGKADLSAMDGTKKLFVSEAVHKAFVDVNEEGTEASGATSFVITFRSSRPQQELIDFVADRPFLFLIMEKTSGNILFTGRLTEPPSSTDRNNIGFHGETAEQRCCVGGYTNSTSAVDTIHSFRAAESWKMMAIYFACVIMTWILPNMTT